MFNKAKTLYGNSSLRKFKIINRLIVNNDFAVRKKTGIKVITCSFQKELIKVKKRN